LEDRPRKIKAAVFPYEDTDVDTLLGMLAGKQFLKRYRMKGLGYIEISNFVKHQKPHPKEPPSIVPEPEDPEPEDEEDEGNEGSAERGMQNAECRTSAERGVEGSAERGVGGSAERGLRNAEWCDDRYGREKPGQSPEEARQSNEAAELSKEDPGLNIEGAGPSHGNTAPIHGIEWSGSEKIGKGLETERGGHEKRWESQEMDEAGLEMNWEEREMEGQNRVLPALTKDRRIEGEERTYSEGKGCGPRGEARGPRGERRGLEGEGWGPEGEGCGVEASRNEGGSAARLERTAGPDAPADRLQSGSSSVEQAGRRARGVAAVQRKSDVQAVFDYWKDRTRHPDAKLTSEREMKIRGRLEEGYTVEQLQEAVEGCRGSPFHQGDNERGHRYDDITLICRSGSKVEQFVEMAREDRDETRQCGNRSNVRKILQGIELVRSRAAESRDAGDDNKQSQGRMLTAGART